MGKQTLESVTDEGMQQGWEGGGVEVDTLGLLELVRCRSAQQAWGSLNSSSLTISQIKQMLVVRGPHGRTHF